MDVGLVTAFLGGALAILSPCGALLLPAFFASTVGSGPRLFIHGGVFYAGLLVVLVPLGAGIGAFGSVFIDHRALVIALASLVMITFGALQIFGIGFDLSKYLPGSEALSRKADNSGGLVKSFLLGMVSGLAGFCAGPILGAVLTLAATSGSVVGASVLLAAYGAGMVVPLLVIASVWTKMDAKSRAKLRGKTFTVLGREFHTTSVATGLLIIAVGMLFWATNGLVTLPSLLPTGVSSWLQGQSSVLANVWVDIGVIALIAIIVLLIWWKRTAPQKVGSAPLEDGKRAEKPNLTAPPVIGKLGD